MPDKSEKKILSEEEIDDLVESQADDDEAWEEPISSLRHGVTADFRRVVYGLYKMPDQSSSCKDD